ncbi:uncharacterized protein [Physcomitrium patens]|uniref:DUF3444 domain-containing protein n=1 Tax=Physcomitrium patens TaxID=3218 RepID=A0A2K1IYH4_PHYPA|nr:hypothetical protein PHYPA_024144 [Physcomitrium patens]
MKRRISKKKHAAFPAVQCIADVMKSSTQLGYWENPLGDKGNKVNSQEQRLTKGSLRRDYISPQKGYDSILQRKSRHYPLDDSSNSDEEVGMEDGTIETDVPDADYYQFDKDRTEVHIKIDEIWAVYDQLDGMPRAWACINEVDNAPKFQVEVTRLKPHKPSEAAKFKQLTGHSLSWGVFELGRPATLIGINYFSHKMTADRLTHSC